MQSISSADANRHFSALLREVAAGEEIVVVSRGKPVARIVGVDRAMEHRVVAKKALLQRLKKQKPTGTRNWSRDDLYA
ncbi:MAG: type II toxin-antitoxin system prevent-host-death family antitoxin [Betaproteobacteria bacterium]|nr:MAG: type II toxin-antitoxin system prevent-host-death family antitoxin [Betaproteobacteria bacterium]